MTRIGSWTWEPWMEPYRSSIFLPSDYVIEDEIEDEVVQAQIGLLNLLRDRNGLVLVPAERSAPTATFSYADRFVLPMLEQRKVLFESYGLMREARLVDEQYREVREWQSRHLEDLTPAPGVIPVRLDGTK